MFIALDGIGGTGKGTLRNRLVEYMQEEKISYVQTREPGGTPIAERLRTYVREGFNLGGDEMFAQPMATTLLFNAARSEHKDRLIIPYLNKGHVVLTDRFCDSTFVYQSVVSGIDLQVLRAIHDLAIGIYPNYTFILDCPAHIAMSRVTSYERGSDQWDRADELMQEKMRLTYLELANQDPGRYIVIDASGTPESVYEQAIHYYKQLMAFHAKGEDREPVISGSDIVVSAEKGLVPHPHFKQPTSLGLFEKAFKSSQERPKINPDYAIHGLNDQSNWPV